MGKTHRACLPVIRVPWTRRRAMIYGRGMGVLGLCGIGLVFCIYSERSIPNESVSSQTEGITQSIMRCFACSYIFCAHSLRVRVEIKFYPFGQTVDYDVLLTGGHISFNMTQPEFIKTRAYT